MKVISATEARKTIYQLIQNLEIDHEPVFIKNKKHSAVMLSESDWNAIQEMLHLQYATA